jgi:hypothetical protein
MFSRSGGITAAFPLSHISQCFRLFVNNQTSLNEELAVQSKGCVYEQRSQQQRRRAQKTKRVLVRCLVEIVRTNRHSGRFARRDTSINHLHHATYLFVAPVQKLVANRRGWPTWCVRCVVEGWRFGRFVFLSYSIRDRTHRNANVWTRQT